MRNRILLTKDKYVQRKITHLIQTEKNNTLNILAKTPTTTEKQEAQIQRNNDSHTPIGEKHKTKIFLTTK